MKKVVLKKENGVTTKGTREIVSNAVYMTTDENCFKDSIKQSNVETYEIEQVQFLNKQLNTIIDNMDYKSIEELYGMIKNVKHSKDLKSIYAVFLTKYAQMLAEKYELNVSKSTKIKKIIDMAKKDIQNNFDLVMSTLIKKIIKRYYVNKMSKNSVETINKLEEMKIRNIPIDYLYKEIGEEFSEQSSKNGVKELSSKILLTTIDELYDSKQLHLCWKNCKNARTDCCEKIEDLPKRTIDNYDFIIDGYQIIDGSGEIDTFVVSKCSNYELQHQKKLNVQERRKLKELKANIFMEYFDAESIEEATEIRDYLIKTGQLIVKDDGQKKK